MVRGEELSPVLENIVQMSAFIFYWTDKTCSFSIKILVVKVLFATSVNRNIKSQFVTVSITAVTVSKSRVTVGCCCAVLMLIWGQFYAIANSDDGMRTLWPKLVLDQGDVHPPGLRCLLKGRSPGMSATSHPDDVLTQGAEQQERQTNLTALPVCVLFDLI